MTFSQNSFRGKSTAKKSSFLLCEDRVCVVCLARMIFLPACVAHKSAHVTPFLSLLPLRHASKQPYHLYGQFKARAADDMWRPGVLYQLRQRRPTAVQYAGPVWPLPAANNQFPVIFYKSLARDKSLRTSCPLIAKLPTEGGHSPEPGPGKNSVSPAKPSLAAVRCL